MNQNYSKSLVLKFTTSQKDSRVKSHNSSLPNCDIGFRNDQPIQNQSLGLFRKFKSVQLTSRQSNNPRIIQLAKTNKTQKNPQKNVMKWIGVHKKSQQFFEEHYQAFPKRKKKTTQQSYHNFILKYGKVLRQPKQSKDVLKLHQTQKSSINNAATVKLKPRLTWYTKSSQPNKYFQQNHCKYRQNSCTRAIKNRNKKYNSLYENKIQKSFLQFE